jgi:hypothetical protein
VYWRLAAQAHFIDERTASYQASDCRLTLDDNLCLLLFELLRKANEL